MITVTLLHPTQPVAVQTWSFDTKLTIAIGRAIDNDVVIYSPVVSRHHVEIQFTQTYWNLVNLGTNGTYIDGKLIQEISVTDGLIVRLARTGPRIQIYLDRPVETTPPLTLADWYNPPFGEGVTVSFEQ